MAKLGALSILEDNLRVQLKCRDLSPEETAAFRDAWRRVYARPLKRAHGVWHRGKYDWHVFSFGDTFALALNDAREAYLAQPRSELIILPNDKKHTGLRTAMVQVPPLDGEADIYISPPNLAWTMVYTHEDGWWVLTSRVPNGWTIRLRSAPSTRRPTRRVVDKRRRGKRWAAMRRRNRTRIPLFYDACVLANHRLCNPTIVGWT